MDGFPFNFRQDRSVSLYPLRLRQPRILCRVLRLSTRPCPQPFPTSMPPPPPPPLVSYAFRSFLSGRRGRGAIGSTASHPLANNARVLAACWMLPFLLLLFSLSFLSSFVRVLYIKDRFSNSLSFFFFKMVLKQSCN